MTRLLAAELLKLRTTRSIIGFAAPALALPALAAAGTVAAGSDSERSEAEWQLDVVTSASFAGLVALLLGVVLVTNEWRHATITPSFLAVPVRHRLMVAKAITGALAGGVFGLLALIVTAAVAVPWLAALGVDVHLGGDTLGRSAGVIGSVAIAGVTGAAVGVLVQNQAAAIVAILLWFLVVEALLGVVFDVLDIDGLADWLPGQASSALDGTIDDGLPSWAGGLVATGWAAILLALGIARTEREDVT